MSRPLTRGLPVPLFAACILIGCSSYESRTDAVPVYPVEGRLFVGKKPAAGALVSFHPEGEGKVVTTTVHDDGRFTPTQGDGAIGLAKGTYAITATWPEGKTDRFAGKNADPTRPLTRVTVQGGFLLIPTIQLP